MRGVFFYILLLQCLESGDLAPLYSGTLLSPQLAQFNDRKRTAGPSFVVVASFAVLPDCLLRLLLRLAFYCLMISKKKREVEVEVDEEEEPEAEKKETLVGFNPTMGMGIEIGNGELGVGNGKLAS